MDYFIIAIAWSIESNYSHGKLDLRVERPLVNLDGDSVFISWLGRRKKAICGNWLGSPERLCCLASNICSTK